MLGLQAVLARAEGHRMTNDAPDGTSAGFEDDVDDEFVDDGVEFSVWRRTPLRRRERLCVSYLRPHT